MFVDFNNLNLHLKIYHIYNKTVKLKTVKTSVGLLLSHPSEHTVGYWQGTWLQPLELSI